jgi:hypothetical protein
MNDQHSFLFAVKLFKIVFLLIVLTWIGSWIADWLYSKRRRTTDKKQRKRLRWLWTIFDLPIHEFHIFKQKTNVSKDHLDWQIDAVEPDVFLRRKNWISFLFILFALLWFGGFLSFFVYFLPWKKLFTQSDWGLFLVCSVCRTMRVFRSVTVREMLFDFVEIRPERCHGTQCALEIQRRQFVFLPRRNARIYRL